MLYYSYRGRWLTVASKSRTKFAPSTPVYYTLASVNEPASVSPKQAWQGFGSAKVYGLPNDCGL
jgi:hypothetical protein